MAKLTELELECRHFCQGDLSCQDLVQTNLPTVFVETIALVIQFKKK